MNPRSLANLKPCRPGEVRNPTGRPKRLPISDHLLDLCREPLPEDVARVAGLKPGDNWGALLAKNLMRKAAKGDMQATREILDRIEGRARQPVDHAVDESVQQALNPAEQMTQAERRQAMLDMLINLGNDPDKAERLLREMLNEDDYDLVVQ